ncbi:MAG: NfeD family protein [Francisellaceae bacterium]
MRLIIMLMACLLSVAWANKPIHTINDNKAVILTISGGIGPATEEYIQSGFEYATNQAAKVVIIEIDTPGGLADAMRGMIQTMLNSAIPTVVYVYPPGGHAASAGTFLLYAADIAAMAPGTNVGAASPVNIGGTPPSTPTPNPEDIPIDEKGQQKPKDDKSTIEKKVFNDSAAYIRALAEMNGRNAKWAEMAVTEAATLTAEEALKENVINVVAMDIPDLLRQINGMDVDVNGKKVTLDTNAMQVEYFEPGWRLEFLQIITDPSIAYLLLVIGVWLLFFEFAHPGLFLPGILGIISILIAIYGLHMLPISYVGLMLMFLGVVLLIAEAFITSFGFLGIGGVVAFTIGSIMLVDTGVPGYEIAMPLILAVSIVTGIFFLLIVHLAIRSYRHRVISGQEGMIGQSGRILVDEDGSKWLFVNGERWRVSHPENYHKHQSVEITDAKGFVLDVKPINKRED